VVKVTAFTSAKLLLNQKTLILESTKQYITTGKHSLIIFIGNNMSQDVGSNLLAQRIHDMSEAATLKMAQAARELSSQGHNVISLSIGEPDFDTPQYIKDFAIEALNEGYTSYSPVPGISILRNAICTKFKRDNNLEFSEENILVSNGAKQAIVNACQALINPGDEVVLPAPFWVSYEEIIKQCGGIPVIVETTIETDFKLTAQQLSDAINEKTKLFLFSNPCNPTGSVYSDNELMSLAEVIAKTDKVCVISDEIYEYINFTGNHTSIGSFNCIKERTATINGFSKGFAMTGWRLGYMGAPAWLTKACAKIQGNVTSGACHFSQVAAAKTLLADLQPTIDMKNTYLRRRDLVIEHLSNIDGLKVNKPEGAFYIFPDASFYIGKSTNNVTINTISDLCEFLLADEHVAVVPGAAFGDEKCFRISFATSDELLVEAMNRIKTSLSKLN